MILYIIGLMFMSNIEVNFEVYMVELKKDYGIAYHDHYYDSDQYDYYFSKSFYEGFVFKNLEWV